MILPEKFISRTKDLLGNEYTDFEKSLSEAPVVSIRANNKMPYVPSDKIVPWCEEGYYLNERPNFTADPLLHAGVYYVQEASSMFISRIVDEFLQESKRVLDLCAAPGGKSTLLSQYLNEDALLVSNEIMHSRANILAENVIKWGNPNVVVTNNKPEDFSKLPAYFDAMLIDAPCSGEGMFRKDPQSVNEWSEENVYMCARRQRTILSSVWDSLMPGGILIYSTCTYNREENEENVQWICDELGAKILKLSSPQNSGITENECGYHFYPHKTHGEGFFAAILRKDGNMPIEKNRKKKNKNDSFSVYKDNLPITLINSSAYEIINDQNYIKVYSKKLTDDYLLLSKTLRCLYSGVLLGERKNKDFLPAHAAALSKIIDIKSANRIDVDYTTAIQYLRRETPSFSGLNKGFFLIMYQGQPLGWVKNIGNRCNNLYPQEWKIRMKI